MADQTQDQDQQKRPTIAPPFSLAMPQPNVPQIAAPDVTIPSIPPAPTPTPVTVAPPNAPAPGAPPQMPPSSPVTIQAQRPVVAPPTVQSGGVRLWNAAGKVQNPVLRTLAQVGAGAARVGDIAAESVDPRLASLVPGSEINTRQQNAANEEKFEKQQALDTQREATEEKPELAELAGEQRGAQQAQRDEAAAQRQKEAIEGAQKRVETQQTGAGERTAATQAGATTRTQETNKTKEQIAAEAQAQAQAKLDEDWKKYQGSDEYRKWKEQLDNDTKLRVSALTQNKAPAAMMQTAEFATGGLNRLADAKEAMQQLRDSGVMGTLPANKVEDWIFGKGLVDPSLDANTRREIGRLRSALSYTSTAAMRAHTGRSSYEIYKDFKGTLGAGQDWNALDGAIDETEKMLGDYSTAASDANIAAIRSGAPQTGAGGALPADAIRGKGGAHSFTYNGKKYEGVPDELYNKYKGKKGFSE